MKCSNFVVSGRALRSLEKLRALSPPYSTEGTSDISIWQKPRHL